jgi:hypothetical protein
MSHSQPASTPVPALTATPAFGLASQAPSSAPTPANPPSFAGPRTHYGRNLRGGYASAWQASQRQKEAALAQLRLTEEAVRNAENTITIVVWREVRYMPFSIIVTLC